MMVGRIYRSRRILPGVTNDAGSRDAPQPCRALCARCAEDDRFLHEGAGFRGQRRSRGRPHHLSQSQPERPPPDRARARPHDRRRDADGAAGVVQRGYAGECADGVPQGEGRRLRGPSPDLPRQCLVDLFPGSRGQPDRDVLRHAVVCAAAPGLQDRPRQAGGRALPRDRGLLPRPRGVQADRGMARRDQQEDRRETERVTSNTDDTRSHPMSEIKGYHAHVYYDPATKPKAAKLRDKILGKFKVEPGGFSDEPRGPHPISQFNVIFETPEFQNIVPWLMLNRDGLDVLVHPLTESSYDDHSKNALWLGNPVPMRLEILRPQYRESLLPSSQRS